jgi:predicted HicB family RNase H-like nuclease
MIDAKNFTISVQYGEFDGDWCYEARVREFPEIIEYADSASEVYDLAIDSIEIICEHNVERGIACPSPAENCDDYSGRMTLRLPTSLHKKPAIDSENEHVSLNQWVVNQLYYAQGAAETAREIQRRASEVVDDIGKALVRQYPAGLREVAPSGAAAPLSRPTQPYKQKAGTKAYH